METNIKPISRLASPARQRRMPGSASTNGNGSGSFGSTLARARLAGRAKRAERMLTGPGDGPPAEVQREMVAAARVWQMLAAEGRELRFGTDEAGRVSVELTDTAGICTDVIGSAGLLRLLARAR